ncbi:MAG: cytidine deaminase [Flavobacteriaceae bacterium]
MRKQHISFELSIYDTSEDLSRIEQKLLSEAEKARENAYAPYSNFKVGAAVLLENGVTVVGNNQENSSYPSGLCAERVAIFHAGAQYPDVTIKSIAISATSKDYVVDVPAGPCGNCRQSIIEYEQKQEAPISILLRGQIGPIYKCDSVADILPLAFSSSFLSDS